MWADVPQMTWYADIKMPLLLFVDKMDGECCAPSLTMSVVEAVNGNARLPTIYPCR